ncbi:MAG: ABC transporter ATP-binding protein [Bacteroidota bacterium]
MKALKVLNKYIWRYKRLLLLGIVFVLISNVFGIYPPQVVRNAIDLVGDLVRVNELHDGFEVKQRIGSMIARSLLIFAGLVIGFALLRGFFLFLTRQTLIVMSRRVEYDLRNDIYSHFQDLSLGYYRRNRTGDLMARITEDVSRVRMYLGPGIMYSINTVSLVIIVVTTMLTVNPELTLYTLIPLPLLSVLIYFVESRVLRRSDRIQQQLSRLTAFTQEIYSGIRVAKAYTREDDFTKRFSEESNDYKERSLRLVRLNSVFFPVVMLLVGMSSAITIWVGAEKVIAGSLSVGNIAEFIIYVSMLTWPIISLGWVSSLIQRAAASQERINVLLREQPEINFPKSEHQIASAKVVFDRVSFTYPHTGIQAVKDVSFELLPGQKLGILGATGSGKSTLVNLIPRLFDPQDGEIRIDGVPTQEFSVKNLRGAVGYAPQDVFLFSDTIRGNVAFGMPGATDAQIESATKQAGIWDNIMGFPEQFATMVGERGVTLSGGQKQRIALARAWIRSPYILILDDSLSAVDTKTEELILGNLRTAREDNPDMSIIMVSHRISTIQDSDLILVMEGGAVIERGVHSDLIKGSGYYSEIYEKQLLEKEMAPGT